MREGGIGGEGVHLGESRELGGTDFTKGGEARVQFAWRTEKKGRRMCDHPPPCGISPANLWVPASTSRKRAKRRSDFSN